MKSYNIPNYIRYKEDIKESNKDSYANNFESYSRDKLIVKFLPLVENIAKKFSTTQQASGVLDITDLIQEGSHGLISAIDKIIWQTIQNSDDPEQTIKSFLSKRIKGAIRRSMDIHRGAIKIPEHKLNEIRNNPDNHELSALFFNSVFFSTDDKINSNDEEFSFEIENSLSKYTDEADDYNIDIMNKYLLSLMRSHLTVKQYDVLRLFYGLDCEKHSAKEITKYLGLTAATTTVIVSQIKKEAIDCLIANVKPSQVIDYL